MTHPNQLTVDKIITALKAQPFKPVINHFPEEFFSTEPRPAAVLIPLVHQDNAWHILFIRRTEVEGDMHSGQVALPGGRKDPEDTTLAATALREAFEELAILREDVNLLGMLNEFITISNYRVTPFVGRIPWPYALTPQPSEVARWFTIPLAWLVDPANHVVTHRELPNGQKAEVIYFKEYDGELLWGLSARIILELVAAISQI